MLVRAIWALFYLFIYLFIFLFFFGGGTCSDPSGFTTVAQYPKLTSGSDVSEMVSVKSALVYCWSTMVKLPVLLAGDGHGRVRAESSLHLATTREIALDGDFWQLWLQILNSIGVNNAVVVFLHTSNKE